MTPFKDYSEAVSYLFHLGNAGVKLNLKTMQELLAAFDHPEKNLPAIHIAGTNGKGSVTTKIGKGLELAGYRAGVYTSPHISTFRERIQVNGKMIAEEDVLRLLNLICERVGLKGGTFFEITTLLAWLYFAEQKVDYVVLETGLGGRLDSTNVCCPILSIITSISLDHTELLGNTLEEIAREKAGIIKPKVPVLVGPRVPFAIICGKGSPCEQIQGSFSTYDEENRALAARALSLLKVPVQGLETLPPCRLQKVEGFPIPIVLDVAHNPDGLRFLFESLATQYTEHSWQVICGLSANKDLPTCLHILSQNSARLHLVQAKHDRAAPLASLSSLLKPHPHQTYPSVKAAVDTALQTPLPLLICGSFFLMDDARQALNIHEPRDTQTLREKM